MDLLDLSFRHHNWKKHRSSCGISISRRATTEIVPYRQPSPTTSDRIASRHSSSDRRTSDCYENTMDPTQTKPTNAESSEVPHESCMNSVSSTLDSASQKSEILRLPLPIDFATAVCAVYASLKGTTRDKTTYEQARTAISYNDSNPSAWVLLRESAEALASTDSKIWESELSYTTTIITESPKNYQAWEHRRFAASKSGLLEPELEFCEMALDNNPKNYHAWAHRAWVVRQGITDGEDESTEWYIRKDVRNNSAWNHRWLVVGASKGDKEMDFVVGMILQAPRNEAAWNYALALSQAGVGKDVAVKCARECIEDDPACISARRFLVLLGEDVSKQCEILASIDTVRSSYWRGREKGFTDPQT